MRQKINGAHICRLTYAATDQYTITDVEGRIIEIPGVETVVAPFVFVQQTEDPERVQIISGPRYLAHQLDIPPSEEDRRFDWLKTDPLQGTWRRIVSVEEQLLASAMTGEKYKTRLVEALDDVRGKWETERDNIMENVLKRRGEALYNGDFAKLKPEEQHYDDSTAQGSHLENLSRWIEDTLTYSLARMGWRLDQVVADSLGELSEKEHEYINRTYLKVNADVLETMKKLGTVASNFLDIPRRARQSHRADLKTYYKSQVRLSKAKADLDPEISRF